MIGVLVLCHGNLGTELVNSMELIVGKQKKVCALTLFLGDDVDALRADARKQADLLDEGDGVLVMVDMPGGSPCNVAATLLQRENTHCLAGANLTMLLTAVDLRDSLKLPELKAKCKEMAMQAVLDVEEMLECSQGDSDEE